MLQARHGSSTEQLWDKQADLAYPRTEISEFMQSPCRPDEQGYFGATWSTQSPTKIFYEFEIEMSAAESIPTTNNNNNNIRQAVTIVQEHLMDVVLASTFPKLCAFDKDKDGAAIASSSANQNNRIAINGFRFGREALDINRT
jgi:hypothetical protein